MQILEHTLFCRASIISPRSSQSIVFFLQPVRDVPEEKLQQMKGVVVALQPASYVEVPKSVDDEAADSFLPEKMIEKSRTQLVIPSKKPTLGEMGYAPAISKNPHCA